MTEDASPFLALFGPPGQATVTVPVEQLVVQKFGVFYAGVLVTKALVFGVRRSPDCGNLRVGSSPFILQVREAFEHVPHPRPLRLYEENMKCCHGYKEPFEKWRLIFIMGPSHC